MDKLENKDLKKTPFTVPEGYFENLPARLAATAETPVVTVRERLRPYLAIAATFLIMVTAGTLLLRTFTPSAEADMDYEAYMDEFIVPQSDLDATYYSENTTGDELTVEDIAEYLIFCGVSVEDIYEPFEE